MSQHSHVLCIFLPDLVYPPDFLQRTRVRFLQSIPLFL